MTAVAGIHAALDEVTASGVDPLYVSTRDKKSLLVGLTRLQARVAALRAEVLAVAEDVAVETADRTAATWLATEARVEVRDVLAAERLGGRLRHHWPAVAAAAKDGAISWEQAQIITGALNQLPSDLDTELVGKAEAHLVTEAGQFGPRPLRRLARKILDVIAPDLADAHEHALLLAEEDRARANTRLSFRRRGDGTTDLHGRLPDPIANRLRVYLEAYTSPRRHLTQPETDTDNHTDNHTDNGSVDQLPIARRRGEAFCALLEHLPANGLPRSGGSATQILVALDHATLVSQLDEAGVVTGVARTSTGDDLTPGQARRLACNAGIIPHVLGGKSQILDQGRSRRLFTGPIRIAMDVRDGGCRVRGCDIPPAWCEAHHLDPWHTGGRTSLDKGALLCAHHHHTIHDPRYTVTHHPNGDITFQRCA
ncbi:MAG: DUF222 domain-containing protein [Nocardioides sp.]